ncbi:MAG: hypothetical protein CVV37_07400 [Nitrospira bacterium HGW-Nitrospira-1]|nr:MAG: hypothetical protein CVV37_07400 [Nitrospira bacterium HGW-Nitrospira-1]
MDFPGRSGTGFLYINGVDYALLNSLGAAGSTTAADLQGMNGNLAGHYALGNDIDASATSVWNGGAGFEPVGNATSPFTGAFDGLGHKITGLHINRPVTDNVGFFGYAVGADIRNTGIVGGSIIGQGTVGGLAGGASSVNHTDPSGTIIYDKKNFIYNSYATCNVSGTWNGGWSGGGAGGLIGANMYGSEIHNSHATGNISGNGHVGGLAGTNRLNATITNSYATGNVTSSPIGYWSGGLVGSHEYGSILENSFATGNVSHTGAGAAGGLTGDNLFIWNGATNIIRNCYATGNVNANVPAGGLVGQNDSGAIIENSYAIGQVTSTHPWVGGLVGANSWWSPGTATIQNSFWDQTTSGQANAAGFNNGTITNCSAKTTAEMKTLSIFTGAGWDIDGQGGTGKVWRIYDGKTYPLLRNFLTPFTIKANDDSKTYDGRRYYGESGITYLEYNKPVSYLSSNLHGAPPSYGGDSQGAKAR